MLIFHFVGLLSAFVNITLSGSVFSLDVNEQIRNIIIEHFSCNVMC